MRKKIKKSKKSRKAQVQNVIGLFVIIITLAITIIFGRYFLGNFYDALDEGGVTTVTSNQSRDTFLANYAVFDYALTILCFVLIGGMMITSFMIPTHPIFIVVNVFGIFVLLFLGMIMTNIYGEFVAGNETALTIGATADQFSLTNFLMNNIAFIGAIAIALTSVITYARSQIT